MANKEKRKDFSFDTVAGLCSALIEKNGSITTAQYELMSALDGSRTACAFQHQFRHVLRRAKELHAQTQAGETAEPVKSKPKGGSKKTTPTKKRGKALPMTYIQTSLTGIARNAKVEDYDDEVEAGDDGMPGEKKAKLEDDGQDMLLTPPEFGDAD